MPRLSLSGRVFKNSALAKLARKAEIEDDEICTAMRRFAMAAKRKYKNDVFETIHSAAEALQKVGAISKSTMRDFDASCLSVPQPLAPKQIKKLRERAHMSQPVFARYLNISASTMEKWETGAKRPSGPALKLLAVVQKHGLDILG